MLRTGGGERKKEFKERELKSKNGEKKIGKSRRVRGGHEDNQLLKGGQNFSLRIRSRIKNSGTGGELKKNL